jgi:hypothetical protein
MALRQIISQTKEVYKFKNKTEQKEFEKFILKEIEKDFNEDDYNFTAKEVDYLEFECNDFFISDLEFKGFEIEIIAHFSYTNNVIYKSGSHTEESKYNSNENLEINFIDIKYNEKLAFCSDEFDENLVNKIKYFILGYLNGFIEKKIKTNKS